MATDDKTAPRIPDQADTELVLNMIAHSEHPIAPSKGFMLESLPSLLNIHMGKQGVSTDVLFERIGLNRATGYRVMNGQRRPSRDMLILHGIMHKKGLGDTNASLVEAGLEPLLKPM